MRTVPFAVCVLCIWLPAAGAPPADGARGGRLVYAQRAEPKTLNPVTAIDAPSREVIRRMTGDLITVNRRTQRPEPNLAESWTVSKDGRHYLLQLRQGLRFSDGHPCDADDVVFTFQVYLDEATHSPQRDLLMTGGKPMQVRKLASHSVAFDLAEPYSAPGRLFDSLAILPRHLLEAEYRKGRISAAWPLQSAPERIAGLGPFRLKRYLPGESIVLERNPFYWKTDGKGVHLPYLDEIDFLFAGSEENQMLRFLAGESDVLNRVSAKNFKALQTEQTRAASRLEDLGPGLDYDFLVFNMSASSGRPWFRMREFRQAVSLSIDREAIARLVYDGRAVPLWTHVTPGNKLWVNTALPRPARSVAAARGKLAAAGFSWDREGALHDPAGQRVAFSIVTSASNQERTQMATQLQDDLKQLGMNVQIAPLEFRAMVDRVMNKRQFDAAVMGLGGGDGDPNSEMNLWLSSGATHLWDPNQKTPATPWEAEVDGLMRRQLTAMDYETRRKLYDRLQQLEAENLPFICLASPNVLVAAKSTLGNSDPVNVDHYTLWNVEKLYWLPAHSGGSR